jgi:glucose/arabinose dehydrogenase
MTFKKIVYGSMIFLFMHCAGKKQELLKADLPLESIKLPEGFVIDVFAEVNRCAVAGHESFRDEFLWVIKDGDKVYAVKDTDGDFKADKKWVIDSGLNQPNGVAFKDGHLYVAEINRIVKYENIESTLDSPPDPVVVNDTYPTETHHGWKYIAFGPDGKLYVPVGAPCNICESEDSIFNSITRINVDGSGKEIYAKGVRIRLALRGIR